MTQVSEQLENSGLDHRHIELLNKLTVSRIAQLPGLIKLD
jgi:hypothetical protein